LRAADQRKRTASTAMSVPYDDDALEILEDSNP